MSTTKCIIQSIEIHLSDQPIYNDVDARPNPWTRWWDKLPSSSVRWCWRSSGGSSVLCLGRGVWRNRLGVEALRRCGKIWHYPAAWSSRCRRRWPACPWTLPSRTVVSRCGRSRWCRVFFHEFRDRKLPPEEMWDVRCEMWDEMDVRSPYPIFQNASGCFCLLAFSPNRWSHRSSTRLSDLSFNLCHHSPTLRLLLNGLLNTGTCQISMAVWITHSSDVGGA